VGFLLAISSASAQDKITLKNGSDISGRIIDVSGPNVNIAVTAGTIPYPLSSIASVQMNAPADLAKAQDATPDRTISLLDPLVKKFKGLPVDWVSEAMATEAEAYSESGKDDQAVAIFNEMSKLYPGSRYQVRALAGLARASLKAGNYDEAISKVAPLIADANKVFSPSIQDGRVYGEAFLVRGEALEKQGKLKEALESYLTVVTVFYQNPTTAKLAAELSDKLRKTNPKVAAD
jgi:tetratricopeptide (TPR) repeat protein